MSNILEKIKNFFWGNESKRLYKLILITIVSGFIAYMVFTNFSAFTSFGAAIFLIAVVALAWYFIDKYLLIGFDTLDELQKGNIAVAIAFLGVCILLGACVISAFVVWH